jgi:hypothetical protein
LTRTSLGLKRLRHGLAAKSHLRLARRVLEVGAEAQLPGSVGANRRLERIAGLIDWAPMERLIAPLRAPTPGGTMAGPCRRSTTTSSASAPARRTTPLGSPTRRRVGGIGVSARGGALRLLVPPEKARVHDDYDPPLMHLMLHEAGEAPPAS